MTELIDTTEMYLRTILELEEEGVSLLRARIAERLGHSGPTVSQTVARMERDGLVTVLPNRTLELSEEGRQRATRVMRKHRLAERLLVDVIGLEYEHVHAEACRWEHVISDRVERKILGLLREHDSSPYGNPIPGLEEFGEEASALAPIGLVNLAELGRGNPRPVLRRIGEPLQNDTDLLRSLQSAGVCAGATLVVERDGADFLVRGEGVAAHDAVRLDRDLASFLFVPRQPGV